MKTFTAVIRKGEKQFVALCPEVDVVSQGYTAEEALSNLREAVELYIEEAGLPKESSDGSTLIKKFEVRVNGKAAQIIRHRGN